LPFFSERSAPEQVASGSAWWSDILDSNLPINQYSFVTKLFNRAPQAIGHPSDWHRAPSQVAATDSLLNITMKKDDRGQP
jgi:hypothetical protein